MKISFRDGFLLGAASAREFDSCIKKKSLQAALSLYFFVKFYSYFCCMCCMFVL